MSLLVDDYALRIVPFNDGKNRFTDGYQTRRAASVFYQNELRKIVKVLENLVSKTAPKLFEIGCGQGEFLDEANSFFSIAGCDVAYNGSNSKILKRFLTDSDKIDCDIIVLRYVIEYIDRPVEFLQTLKRTFKGDPLVYIEGPLLEESLKRNYWFDICEEQTGYYTSQYLRSLFAGKTLMEGGFFGGEYFFVVGRLSSVVDTYLTSTTHGVSTSMSNLFENFEASIRKLTKFTVESDGATYIWGAARRSTMAIFHLDAFLTPQKRVIAAIDIDQCKRGHFLPGSGIPIINLVDYARSASEKDSIIITNENYLSEIRESLGVLNIHPSFCIASDF